MTDRERVLFLALAEAMEWIDNWAPSFTNDDEWPAAERMIRGALAPEHPVEDEKDVLRDR